MRTMLKVFSSSKHDRRRYNSQEQQLRRAYPTGKHGDLFGMLYHRQNVKDAFRVALSVEERSLQVVELDERYERHYIKG